MSKTSKYLLMIGIYLFLSLLFLIGIECGLRAFGYGVDLDHLFLQTANGKYLYLNKNISRRYFTQSQATNGNVEFFRKKKQKNRRIILERPQNRKRKYLLREKIHILEKISKSI